VQELLAAAPQVAAAFARLYAHAGTAVPEADDAAADARRTMQGRSIHR
jgi:hypothetical protein